MRPLTIVSYPRSGRNMTLKVLGHLLGTEIAYDGHTEAKTVQGTPLVDLGIETVHEINQVHTPVPGRKYLVLVRNPIRAVHSHAMRRYEEGRGVDKTHNPTPAQIKEFFGSHNFGIQKWERSHYKWCVNTWNVDKLIVKYDDFVNHTERVVQRLSVFIGEPYRELDFEILPRYRLEECTWHDDLVPFYYDIEDEYKHALEYSGINKFQSAVSY